MMSGCERNIKDYMSQWVVAVPIMKSKLCNESTTTYIKKKKTSAYVNFIFVTQNCDYRNIDLVGIPVSNKKSP